MSEVAATYTEGRTCEMCDGPNPDDHVPNDYDLYGYCPKCVAEIEGESMRDRLELITAGHTEVGGNVCGIDGDQWPCDTGVALARIADLERERDAQAEAVREYKRIAWEQGEQTLAARNALVASEQRAARLVEIGNAMSLFVVLCDSLSDLRLWLCQACWQRADHPASIVHYTDCSLSRWRAALAGSAVAAERGEG